MKLFSLPCRLGGDCDLVSRDGILKSVGVAQCTRCSQVYEAVAMQPRVCDHCQLAYGESLHDPCLGTLPNVIEACCGHGDESKRYTVSSEGVRWAS